MKSALALCVAMIPVCAVAQDTCFGNDPSCFISVGQGQTGTWIYDRTPPPLAPSPNLPYLCVETDLRFVEGGDLVHPNSDPNSKKCRFALKDRDLNWMIQFDTLSNKNQLRVFSGPDWRDYVARFRQDNSGRVYLTLSTIIPESPTKTYQTHYHWQPDNDG